MPNIKPFSASDFTIDPASVKVGVELGRGNFSKVYKGQFEGRSVAIKRQEVVDADLERYLLMELAILRQMKHEGCIKFYGAFKEADNIINIVTEYLEGGDLRRLLQDKQVPLGWKFRARMALGCARALAYMHSLEIIHRDIKTDNCLLGADGSPKLCDFGFARQWDKSKTMTMCGTDEFMAPEIQFSMPYDEKVDVFSFGIMLGELVTRKIPGKREGFLDRGPSSGFTVDDAELEREYKAVSSPAKFLALTKSCCDPEQSSRLSAEAVSSWLDELVKELPADREPAPALTSDAISNKLQEYLAKESAAEFEDDDDDEKRGGSKKVREPRSPAEAKKLDAAKAQQQRDAAGAGASSSSGKTPPKDSPKKPASSGSGGGGGGPFALCFSSGEKRSATSAGKASNEMAGWVTKRGGRIKTWKRRYMVVTPEGIMYYKSPEEKEAGVEPQGQIYFSEMTHVAGVVTNAVPTVMTGKPNSFGVHTEGRIYYIAALNVEDRGKWIRAISDGHRNFEDRQKMTAAAAATSRRKV